MGKVQSKNSNGQVTASPADSSSEQKDFFYKNSNSRLCYSGFLSAGNLCSFLGKWLFIYTELNYHQKLVNAFLCPVFGS